MTVAFAWAVQAPADASPPHFIHSGTVRSYRSEAQACVGQVWDEDVRRGWRIAYRRGWRCIRVCIQPAFGMGVH